MSEQKITPNKFLRKVCADSIIDHGFGDPLIKKNISVVAENHYLIESLLAKYADVVLEEYKKKSLEYTGCSVIIKNYV